MPLNKRATPQLIGLFVVGAIMLAVAGVLVFGPSGLFTQKERYVLYFSGSVKGLNPGAPVNFRGVKIGTVVSISVHVQPEQLTFLIPVIIEIEPGRIAASGPDEPPVKIFDKLLQETSLKRLIDKGLRAQLQLQSLLTGQLFVQLDLFPNTPVVLVGQNGEYREIPTIPSGLQELSQTFDKIPLEEVAQKTISTLDGLVELVHNPDLTTGLAKFNRRLDQLETTLDLLNRRLPQSLGRMDEAFAAVEAAAQRIESGVEPTTTDLHQTAEAIRRTMEQTQELVAQLQQATAQDSTLRYRLATNLDELNKTLRSIRMLSETLERHPDAVLRGKGLGGQE